MSEDEKAEDYEFDVDKRAHHNALERKRRDHIKDSFSSLREALPSFQNDKASRAQILKKAADYIQNMRRKNISHQNDIDDLKRQNKNLEDQIRMLEKAKATGNYSNVNILEVPIINSTKASLSSYEADSDSEASSDTTESTDGHRKRLKTA
ncbi:protein max isoform X2 [Parasteatoda tepidariorum]|uniref:protein max isoform X2 n=1 Tax=Parasteatoda tepidariorum TaxID=114398 RepID=UPI00077FC7B6|nr:protein max isoform X2 [Parasteatoda tepidariorum]